MISHPSIVARVVDAAQAARDYAQIIGDTQFDPEMRRLMLCSHGFELAKRVIDPRATKFGPTHVQGTKASLCLVVNERAVFVVVQLITGEVSIVSDERVRRAS